MSMELQEQCAKLMPEAPEDNSRDCLFVSTSLATWTTVNPEQFARDFQISDTVSRYRACAYPPLMRSRQRQWPWSIRSARRHYRLAGSVKGSMPLAAAVSSTRSAGLSAF